MHSQTNEASYLLAAFSSWPLNISSILPKSKTPSAQVNWRGSDFFYFRKSASATPWESAVLWLSWRCRWLPSRQRKLSNQSDCIKSSDTGSTSPLYPSSPARSRLSSGRRFSFKSATMWCWRKPRRAWSIRRWMNWETASSRYFQLSAAKLAAGQN